ncbi:hypothetical protein DL93DRAFT_2082983 [Clavulina sp. PMI_390]|nr:hypothetical protein DL93DRAFT_2082983 [Clavulina sp. PMI_390]
MHTLIPFALSILLGISTVSAGQSAQAWVPPAPCPLCPSPHYVGPNNGTLVNSPLVPGKAFDRFIQVWLENTDFSVAASSPTFQKLAKQGVTMSSYLALTHPSEPNYIAAVSGDFWGLGDDRYFHVPDNITTIVDLLEQKNISWATYQENMPRTAHLGDFTQENYIDPSSGSSYTYFVRKHNPLGIHNSVVNDTSRAPRIRNFNDFAADLNASALPQWSFITPNLVNDAHDTSIDFVSQWLEWWLVPMLENDKFNTDRTLVLLTWDENENYAIRNNVFSLLLGKTVPKELHGTIDNTLYSHYSTLSTVEGNWGLDNLGRGDVNDTMSNVFDFVATSIKHTNTHTPLTSEPLTNLTQIFPGPLNPDMWIPFTAPPRNVSRFGGSTLVRPGLDWDVSVERAGMRPVRLAYEETPNAGFGDNIVFEHPTSSPPKSSGDTVAWYLANPTGYARCIFDALFQVLGVIG